MVQRNDYILLQNEGSPSNTYFTNAHDTSLKRSSSLVKRSTTLCRRISGSIKKNIHDSLQSNRESKKEKRPQDGKTNPME